jgi:hypothetical protein
LRRISLCSKKQRSLTIKPEKKAAAVEQAAGREIETVLALIREEVRESGSLDMAWIERTLRDSASRRPAYGCGG